MTTLRHLFIVLFSEVTEIENVYDNWLQALGRELTDLWTLASRTDPPYTQPGPSTSCRRRSRGHSPPLNALQAKSLQLQRDIHAHSYLPAFLNTPPVLYEGECALSILSTDGRPKHARTQSTRRAYVRMINQVDTTMILLEVEKEMCHGRKGEATAVGMQMFSFWWSNKKKLSHYITGSQRGQLTSTIIYLTKSTTLLTTKPIIANFISDKLCNSCN